MIIARQLSFDFAAFKNDHWSSWTTRFRSSGFNLLDNIKTFLNFAEHDVSTI